MSNLRLLLCNGTTTRFHNSAFTFQSMDCIRIGSCYPVTLTLTYDLDHHTSPRKWKGEQLCHICRSKVNCFENYRPNTQIHTVCRLLYLDD